MIRQVIVKGIRCVWCRCELCNALARGLTWLMRPNSSQEASKVSDMDSSEVVFVRLVWHKFHRSVKICSEIGQKNLIQLSKKVQQKPSSIRKQRKLCFYFFLEAWQHLSNGEANFFFECRNSSKVATVNFVTFTFYQELDCT